MTTTAIDTQTGKRLSQLTFGGVLRSEWIKLISLRSTLWCYLILIVVTVGLGLLLSLVRNPTVGGAISAEAQRATAVQAITAGTSLGQLIVAVLGALVITGEYGTGMIRSTLTAVPKRTPALVAKALVFGVTTFVVALVAVAATALITAPLFPNVGVHVDILDSRILLPLLGDAGYLALLGMLSLAIGAIIRSSAGGIAAAIGLVLVVPIVLSIVYGVTQAMWARNVDSLLPGSAGGRMYAYVPSQAAPVTKGLITLDPTQGTLLLVAWVVVIFVVAAVLLKRRDA
jgi:ABC-2 type transport system permease protein